MMRDYDFMLTEEQRELRDLVEEFAQNEVKPICREAEKEARVPEELMKKAVDMGLHMVSLPEQHGGLGLTPKIGRASCRERV